MPNETITTQTQFWDQRDKKNFELGYPKTQTSIQQTTNQPHSEPEMVIHLIGSFIISHKARNQIQSSFSNFVFPAFALHIYSHVISYNGLATLSNILYSAPLIALLGCLIRFIYLAIKCACTANSRQKVLAYCFMEVVKTSITLLLTYLAWTLAVSIAIKLSILSGGTLPLGILLICSLTAFGSMIAKFINRKVPKLFFSPKKSWGNLIAKITFPKKTVLADLTSRFFWSSIAALSFKTSQHIASSAITKAVSSTGIGLLIVALYCMAVILISSLSRQISVNKKTTQETDLNTVKQKILVNKSNSKQNIFTRKKINNNKFKKLNYHRPKTQIKSKTQAIAN